MLRSYDTRHTALPEMHEISLTLNNLFSNIKNKSYESSDN